MRLVRDEQVYETVRRQLAVRGIAFNELNRGQALVPDGCTVLPNRNGTAPGMWFERGGKILVSMPGVPFEMKALVTDEVLPRLRTHFSLHANVHRTAITFGLAESILAERIAPWEAALPANLRLAYLPLSLIHIFSSVLSCRGLQSTSTPARSCRRNSLMKWRVLRMK